MQDPRSPSEDEARFRVAFELAPIGMALTGLERRWIRVNRALCEMLGYTEDELLELSYQGVTHPDDRTLGSDLYEQLLARRLDRFELEKRYVRKDGAVVWVDLSVALVASGDEHPLGSIAQIQDVSERKLAAAALRRRDEILVAMASAPERLLAAPDWRQAVDGLLAELGHAVDASRAYLCETRWVDGEPVDVTLCHEWCAPNVEPQLGRPSVAGVPVREPGFEAWMETLCRLQPVQAHTPALAPQARAELERQGIESLLAVPVPVDGRWWGHVGFDECRARRVWSPAEIEALRVAAGAIGATIQRTAAERSRREFEQQHRLLVESLPLVTYVDRADATISAVFVSPQVREMLGYTPDEWISDPEFFGKILHPDDHPIAYEDDWPEGPGPHVFEYRLRAADGRYVWIHDEYRLVRDEDGTPLYSQGYMIDITERRLAEEALIRRDAILEAVAASAELLLVAPDWHAAVGEVLRRLGEADQVSRAYILERARDGDADTLCQTCEWVAPGVASQLDREEMQRIRSDHPAFAWLFGAMNDGLVVQGHRHDFPEGFGSELAAQGIRSLVHVPLMAGDSWSGLIGFDQCDVERVWTRSELEALRAAAGAIGAAISRNAADTARREAEELYRALVDASPVAIVVLDLDENVLLWNESAERVYGWTADEVVGRPLPSRPEQLDHEYRLFLESSVREGRVAGFETFRRRKDGRLIDVSISLAAVHDATGKVVGTLSAHVDVTDAKRSEQALRERERQFRAVFDTSHDALAIIDDDGHLLEVNEAAAALYGRTKAEILGRTIEELAIDEQRSAVEALWRSVLREGEIETEFELVRPDGSRRSLEFAARANFLPGRHLTAARDVTDRKALEAQLLHSQRMEAVGRLAGGIAHDFNNLLTAIQGYADFLRDGLDTTSPLLGDAEQISRAAERAAGLVRQLLAFSRKQLLRPEIVDLNAVVRETEAMLRRLIGEDVDLVTALEPPLASVLADAGQLEQTIINLAVNARDAMPDGGSLTVTTATVVLDRSEADRIGVVPGRYVRLDVRDTGVGMDGGTRLRAFEPFFTTKEQGTGLGLATVYGIVTQSGGQIDVASEPEKGTTFTVYLPAASGPVRRARDGHGPDPTNGGSETVLLVEDEDIVRSLARRILNSSGYEVIEAGSGREALDLAGEHGGRIDLLLTDVVMPGMNGRELADRLTDLRPGTRVVYMSGYTEDAVVKRGVPGDRAFLAKPFTPAALAQEVRDALDSARP